MSKEKQIEEMAEITKDHCLIENQCGSCHWETCNECFAEFLYEKGYRKQSEWISVDERLPETKFTNVKIERRDIASGKTTEAEDRMMNTSELVVVLYKAHMNGKFGVFVGLDQFVDGHWAYTDVVTHWMQLPEPPEMKGE